MRNLSQIEPILSKNEGKKTVLVAGNFNVIHPGHLRVLRFARSCGDALIVALFADQSPGVIVNAKDRAGSLMALEVVDDVIIVEPGQLIACINSLKPYAVVKGKEHEGKFNPEREAVELYGGHLVFSSGEQNFSSKDLIRHELSQISGLRVSAAMGFLAKHRLNDTDLVSRIRSFRGANFLVLGDLILDEYIYCDPLGLSQEDPTIVVTPIEIKRFIGAAGIVAAHLTGMGAEVTFCSIVGADDSAEEGRRELERYGVTACLIHDETRPTILKQRYRAHGKTLLRVSHLRSHDASEEYWRAALEKIQSKFKDLDGVVFSDFNYGCLPQTFVDVVIYECQNRRIPYFADSQASSQVGDVSRFIGAELIAATEREARIAMRDYKSGLQNVANALESKAMAQNLLIKLGAEGVLAIRGRPDHITDSLPALNQNPIDVAGAGDAMLAAAVLTLTRGGSIFEAAYLGSVAAGIQVSRTGNLPVTREDLIAGVTDRATR